MIRLTSAEESPLANCQCPFDILNSSEECSRPYCPFKHLNRPIVLPATVPLVEVKQEPEDDDVIVIQGPEPTVKKQSPMTTSKQGGPTFGEVPAIRQENPTNKFLGGYVGYLASGHASAGDNYNIDENANGTTTTQRPQIYEGTSAANMSTMAAAPNQEQKSAACSFYHQPPFSGTGSYPERQFFVNPKDLSQRSHPPPALLADHHFSSTPPAFGKFGLGAEGLYSLDLNPTPLELRRRRTKDQEPVFLQPFGNNLASNDHHQPGQDHSHQKSEKPPRKDKSAVPMYVPTPISQLEREKELKEKREQAKREVKERDERVKKQEEQLGKQKMAIQRQAGKALVKTRKDNGATATKARGPSFIDQLIADQEHLLDEMTDDPERRRQELAKIEMEKRKEKERLKKIEELRQQQKGVTLKGGQKAPTNIILTSTAAAPSSAVPSAAEETKKDAIMTEKESEKEKDNGKKDEKVIKKGKVKEKNGLEKVAKKPKQKTVIADLIEKEKKRKGIKRTGEDAERKEKEASPSKKAKLNDYVKHVAQLDKDILELERKLKNNEDDGKPSTSSSISTELSKPNTLNYNNRRSSLEGENGSKTTIKEPVWRENSKSKENFKSFLDDPKFYYSTQKHVFPEKLRESIGGGKLLMDELFGKESDEKTGHEKRRSGDEKQKGKERKKRISSGEKDESRKRSKPKEKEEEDETTRLERQALIDLISEGEDSDMDGKRKNSEAIVDIETEAKAIEPSSTSLSIQPQPTSRSRSSSISSVSIVPATPSPCDSPTKPNAHSRKQQFFPSNSVKPTTLKTTTKPIRRLPTAQEQLLARTTQFMQSVANDKTKEKDKQAKSTDSAAHWLKKSANAAMETNQFVPVRMPMHAHRPAAPKARAAHLELPSSSSSLSVDARAPFQSPPVQLTLPTTWKKGEARKAHTPKIQSGLAATRQLVPLEPQNRKVPLNVRQMRLAAIHAEYKKIYFDNPDLAIQNAQQEELEMLQKCMGKIGYVASATSVIKRLREFAANDNGQQGRRDSVSHNDMLLGRHAKEVTLGLNRAGSKLSDGKMAQISELDFYNALAEQYLLTEEQLWLNGYPRWPEQSNISEMEDEERPRRVEIRQSDLDAGKSRDSFIPDNVLKRVCARCGTEYRLTKDGEYAPGSSSDECVFHWGRAWKKRAQGTLETRYNCCDSTSDVRGCTVSTRHITQTLRLSTLENYVDTPKPFGVGDPRSKKVYALDCEMVYTVWGPEVARLSMVDLVGELMLDLLIRPGNTLIDCNTKFSGLTPDQVLNAECDLNQARERLFELVNNETILVGHSLESDLRTLRIVHKRVVDTSIVFPHRLGPPQKRALKTLASEIIQLIIQEDESGHDSKEDALACIRIMLRKVRGTTD